ncbi:unnamed protein product [marine sediment metagenome]|uniref:Bacillithiol biosynthesis BshC N-terminal Rossmann-like domain-containing protein n=1 Tax=marine sediment metagenome TaxID=412755 RepID=X1RT94_9ZZZZ
MENIEMLLDENTYTVVTGQQPGIFTGPLYTIYKALSAIIVANNHSDKNHPLVPIFWNASEDHDPSEVDHIYLMHNNYPRKISYPVRGEKSTSEIRLDKEKIDPFQLRKISYFRWPSHISVGGKDPILDEGSGDDISAESRRIFL